MKYKSIKLGLLTAMGSIILMLSLSQTAIAAGEKWKIRARGIGIVPADDSGTVFLNGNTGQGAGVEVDAAVMPEVDITYMITPHWGVEAIASMANHDVNIDGTPTGTLAAVGGNGTKLFDTWVLPPTVTLQYHFMPEGNIRPYVGVGVNYTATLFDDATDGLETAVGGPVDVSSSNSWGWALQAGIDYEINDKWFFNADMKYIDIDTTARINVVGGALAGNGFNVDVDVNPFVLGLGVGYRF